MGLSNNQEKELINFKYVLKEDKNVDILKVTKNIDSQEVTLITKDLERRQESVDLEGSDEPVLIKFIKYLEEIIGKKHNEDLVMSRQSYYFF